MIVTNPDKVYFPVAGHTKMDLVRYYLAVAEGALAGAGGRPMALKRPAKPSTSSVGKNNSPKAPATAATCGDNTGVWYSFSNKYSVLSHEVTLR